MPTLIELLSPAKNADIGRCAILHGADAIYIGAPSHGARQAAANSISDIARLADFAHTYGARVYVTVNTLVYDSELADVERLIKELYRARVDALIVQDLGILRLDLPPIALHASTQCDIRTPEKARFLADLGFTQLVLPREMTLKEIAAVKAACPDIELEAFVHGALCVSYSGDCQASLMTTGRSANRGACAQICRLPFDLYDGTGKCVQTGRHLLSLRDLNRVDHLRDMLDAGITSFKIEGRLKDEAYVKNVTAAYSQALDAIVETVPDRFARSSTGRTELGFTPDLAKSFNRGYTSFFLTPEPRERLANHMSPKHIGEIVGTVKAFQPGKNVITANLLKPLANGDGLGFFDKTGTFVGFRLNRVDGSQLFCAPDSGVGQSTPAPGTKLFRNSDKRWNDSLSRTTARRTRGVDIVIRTPREDVIVVDASTIDNTIGVSVSASVQMQTAQTPNSQEAVRERIIQKTGDTPFYSKSIDDRLGDRFVPASVLTELRREALQALEFACQMTHKPHKPGKQKGKPKLPDTKLTYHDNVANALSRELYTQLGATEIDSALEVEADKKRRYRVMTTRYCLRRELGACLRQGGAKKLAEGLRLKAPGMELELEFDCKHCQMHVFKVPEN